MREKRKKEKNFRSLFEYYGFTKKEKEEYPIISKILTKLTPKRIEKELIIIKNVKFPPLLEDWVTKYKTIGYRDDFVFRWCYYINKRWIMLENIPERLCSSLEIVKTLFNIFIVLIDDVSERKNKKFLLMELLHIPSKRFNSSLSKLSNKDRKYFSFTLKTWLKINEIIARFPNYKNLKDIFEFDVEQFLDAVRYGYLITTYPWIMNELEYWTFFPQSMQILIDADFDLMCLEKFELENLWKFREMILLSQKMARIGNWLTTWEREGKEGDFTSVVFPKSLKKNILTIRMFFDSRYELILDRIKNSGVEKEILKVWEEYYRILRSVSVKSKFINKRRIYNNLKFLIFMHLLSRGYK